MSGFEGIVGHERVLRVLGRALMASRVAHAYLFWGPDGVGKELVAREMAAVLLCGDPGAMAAARPCGACPACAKTAKGSHPDLSLLAPGEKDISVKDVRAFQQALSFQAYERGRKVAIIRDAQRMSLEGANALLKTVEEPPRDTFLFILAPHKASLLPTLVSRCQPMRFDPLGEADVARVLTARGVSPAEAARLAALSAGSPGLASTLDGEAFGEVDEEVVAVVRELPEMGAAERFEVSERWAKDKEMLDFRLKCLERALTDAARRDPEQAARLARLHRVRGLIERNINAQLALDALLVLDAGQRLEELL